MNLKISKYLIVFILFLAGSAIAQDNKILSTKLQITILNNLGNPVMGAQVSIYESEDDYLGDKNVIGTVMAADKKGRVMFKDLKPIKYYIYARDGSMDNEDGNQHTEKLREGLKNKITVIISD